MGMTCAYGRRVNNLALALLARNGVRGPAVGHSVRRGDTLSAQVMGKQQPGNGRTDLSWLIRS